MAEIEIIETLLAEKGKRYEEDGQVIASYGRSIVFLPKGVQPGQKVRVKLEKIREDSRGRMMYRGVPAPVEYTERWKDNGDGTASRVKVAIDWFLKESEVEVIETRKLESREARAWLYTERSVVWGSFPTSSFVEEVDVRSVPIESEVVKNGALVWERTSEREERGQPFQRPVSRVEAVGGKWFLNRFNTTYEPSWSLELRVYFQVEGEEKYITQTTTWGEIPNWLQVEISARYPVCSCGRQRRDVEVPDGYDKCELCRAQETCERCGKQAKIAVIHGKMVCDACQPYEEQEQLIAQHLSPLYREQIAAEAKKLLQGQALESELGFQVLKAGLGHITCSYTRDRILRRYEGYRWYYFTDEGVFGTKFEPAALQVLQYLPQAAGNSLVELVAWVVGGPKPSGPDFYLRTQVYGESGVSLPQITEDQLKQVVANLEAGQRVLAYRLRDSEADRLAALEAFRQAEDLASFPNSKIRKLYEKARQALKGEEQDYKTALKALQEVLAERERQKVLEDLLVQEYSSCPVCGKEWDFREESHYCERQEELRARGQYQEFTVKVSKIGNAELVKIVAEYDDRYNEYELRLVVDRSVRFSDSSEIKTVNLWREPSARERELAEELRATQAELDRLEDELSRCEGESPSRVKVTFQEGVDPKGRQQLQAEGVFTGSVENRKGFSDYTEQEVLFVCRRNCPWLEEQPQAGQTWVCSIAFQIGVDKRGWPVVVVNPQVRVDRKAELEEKLARLKQELEAERKRVDPFDENGNPKTAMAQALRKAGLI